MASTGDAKTFGPISASTAAFTLFGGEYGVTYSATWNAGSLALQILGADRSTWVPISTFTSNGMSAVNLPAGQYRFAVTSATAMYAAIARILQA